MRYIIIFLLSLNILYAQRNVEKLNRGLVAVRTGTNQVFVSWRLLGTEAYNTAFNVYRGGTKVNARPIANATNFVDNTNIEANYTVRAVINDIEQQPSEVVNVWTNQYLDIPLKVPADGKTPKGDAYTYSPNDCSVGDVDGDGEYEIFVKWDPSNSQDNANSGYTGNVFIDCYKMNGKHLWRVDLGRNIRAGAHYTQFMVYDFDGDGKAEMACRTADATIDGLGKVIGNATADYRTVNGYILTGPEFLTMFSGLTGEALHTIDYVPARGTVTSWGDNYGNRVDRFVAAVAYLDGKNASLVMGRGYYTRLVRAAYDWKDGKLVQRWVFDSNNNKSYDYQGNHNMSVGDVDGDGKDEIINGSSAIDDDGKPLYANGLGHGDAMHVSDMNPDLPGLELWQCHESPGSYGAFGLEFRDAKTGKPLWGVDGQNTDVGRCMAGDIDPRHKGYECWGPRGGLYNCKGEKISDARPSSMNFGIWWDGDLSRELLDDNLIYKWDYQASKQNAIFTANGFDSCNGTKATPNVSADLFGDWREEVVLRSVDNKFLRIYTTTIPTTQKIYTLMHDTQYKVAVAWQNSAYNQPPHPSFYLGDGMTTPTKPNVAMVNYVENLVMAIEPTAKKWQIFPNPSKDYFVIKSSKMYHYRIIDLNGKVFEAGLGIGEKSVGQTLANGTYFVILENSTEKNTIKIIKQ